jgi:arsenate reductase
MAAGWLRRLAGDRIDIRSAGTRPADRINPTAVAAMAEVGIDITTQQPKVLDHQTAGASDIIITMGCGDTCPYFPGKTYLDWQLDDPAGQPLDVVRRIRDDIRDHIEQLVTHIAEGRYAP